MKLFFTFCLCTLFCIASISAQSIMEGGTAGGLKWELFDYVLTVRGEGPMPDYTMINPAPWNVHKNNITSVEIELGVTSIGDYAFFSCTGLKSIIIPESVISIGEYAFNNCPALTSVIIPTSVNTISDWAFVGCTGLTSVNIPESVTFVSSSAFEECSRLISITVDPANLFYSSKDDVLFNKDRTTLVTFPAGRSGNYTISESVTSIDNWAFSFCIGLTSIVLPKSLTSIGISAFYGCSALSSIAIPGLVTSIGEYAFGACTGLTSIVIPASLISINNTVFYSCINLSEIINLNPTPQIITNGTFDGSIFPDCILRVYTASVDDYHEANVWKEFAIEAFPNGTTGPLTWEFAYGTLIISGEGEIPDFYNENIQPWHAWKDHITSVDIGEGITVIGSNAFHSYSGITSVSISGTVETIKSGAFIFNNFTSVTIPASVTSIDPMAMTGCSVLTSITVDGANPSYASENGVLFNKEKTILITYPIGKEGAYSIPEPVETIGDFAFCYGKLTSVTIPASVTSIGKNAFYRTGITSIVIPELVANIGNEALAGCSSMTSISADPANPNYSSVDGVLFNKEKTTLVAFPSGRTGDYAIPQSVETIGHGAFWESKLTSVDISASVTSIGDFAFRISGGLTSVDIPASVTSIGAGAFLTCYGLTSVTIPASATFTGGLVFDECVKLSEINNYSVTPQTITDTPELNIFPESIFSTCILRVPAGSVKAYSNADVWKKFKNIVTMNAELTIDEDEIYLLRGASMKMTVNGGEPSDPYYVSWITDNPEIATVDETGTITAVGLGATVISATVGRIALPCTVTVIEKGTSSIEGTIDYTGTETVTVKIYINEALLSSLIKGRIAGGYVLLATTVPNDQGKYHFDGLPEGSYQIEVVAGDFDTEATKEISLSENTTLTEVNFTIDSDLGIIIGDIPTTTKELFVPDLKIFPNPFTDVVHIAGAAADIEPRYTLPLRIYVVNTAGVIVHTQIITNLDTTVHLGHLLAGMYIIRMENDGKVKAVQVVKR